MNKMIVHRRNMMIPMALVMILWAVCGCETSETDKDVIARGAVQDHIKIPKKLFEILETHEIPEPPLECSTEKLKIAYKWGYARGWRKAAKIARRYHCDQIEQFADRLADMVNISEEECNEDKKDENHRWKFIPHGKDEKIKERRRCQIAGSLEGVLATLDYAFESCGIACGKRGEIVGKVSAETYCHIVIETGGIIDVESWARQSLNYCGLYFEMECDITYETTSFEFGNGTCTPYTEEKYFEQWDNYRLKSCDYSQNPSRRVSRPKIDEDDEEDENEENEENMMTVNRYPTL